MLEMIRLAAPASLGPASWHHPRYLTICCSCARWSVVSGAEERSNQATYEVGDPVSEPGAAIVEAGVLDHVPAWADDEWFESSHDIIDEPPARGSKTAAQDPDPTPDFEGTIIQGFPLPAAEFDATLLDVNAPQSPNNHQAITDLDGEGDDIAGKEDSRQGRSGARPIQAPVPSPQGLGNSEERASLLSQTSWPPQPTPPPTAPSGNVEQVTAPLTPGTKRQTQTLQGLSSGNPIKGVLPPTPSLTQQELLTTPGMGSERQFARDEQLPAFSDAVSPWFAPSRRSVPGTEVQDEFEYRDQEHDHATSEKLSAHSPHADTTSGMSQESTTESDTSLIARAKARLFDISRHVSEQSSGVQTRSKIALRANVTHPFPKGLRTSLSYYTPLHPTHLRPLLNSPSQHESTVDVIAIVSSHPTPSKRADKGPRDWHRALSITTPEALSEPSEWPSGQVRTQCFMRGANGRALLPRADPGDVILLRDFSIVSQSGQIGLMNKSRGCGWCVFRSGRGAKSELAKHGGTVSDVDESEGLLLQEECLGAPVEVGEEERKEAARLKRWWEGLLAQEDDSLAG